MPLMPEYARAEVSIYITNPSADSAMSVSGRLDLDGIQYEAIAEKFIQDFNKLTGRDDSCLMTEDEVKAYLENDK